MSQRIRCINSRKLKSLVSLMDFLMREIKWKPQEKKIGTVERIAQSLISIQRFRYITCRMIGLVFSRPGLSFPHSWTQFFLLHRFLVIVLVDSLVGWSAISTGAHPLNAIYCMLTKPGIESGAILPNVTRGQSLEIAKAIWDFLQYVNAEYH